MALMRQKNCNTLTTKLIKDCTLLLSTSQIISRIPTIFKLHMAKCKSQSVLTTETQEAKLSIDSESQISQAKMSVRSTPIQRAP